MVKEFKEKIITINLKKAFEKPVTKRAKSSLFALKKAIRKETRIDEIKISNGLNELIWQRGLFKSPRKILVKLIKEKNIIRACLPDEKIEIKQTPKKKDLKSKAEEKVKELQKETKTKKEDKTVKNKEEKPKKEDTKETKKEKNDMKKTK